MSKVTPALNAQAHVNEYFQTHAAHWNDIYGAYGDGDVWSHVHRDRHQMALGWVESLALAPGAHVLEVGCGAGLFAVDLALRGLHVVAIDPVEAMVAQARQHAAQAGVDD